MTKITILDSKGNKAKEINSRIFDFPIRYDIVQKIAEAEKEKQLYAPFYLSGMQTSASGNVKHNRHVWKTDRGKGMSRFPKKRLSDKGERFVWVAAAIPGVRGGRRAHPPKLLRKELKINQKEKNLGFLSAFAMTASAEDIMKKYPGIKEAKINLPIVAESGILSLNTKDFFVFLKKALGEKLFGLALQKSCSGCGIGKMRGRNHKKSAGMLLITANTQDKKVNGIDVKKAGDVKIMDMASNGSRIVMFTEEALKDIEKKYFSGAEE